MPITNASKLADFASGASATNTSVIQVDYTNQRVGIGTTNPTSKLTVNGDTRVGFDTSSGVILTSANGTKYRLLVSNAGAVSTVVVP